MCFENDLNGCATKLPYLSNHTFAVSGNFLTLIFGSTLMLLHFSSVLVHVVWRVLVACHPASPVRRWATGIIQNAEGQPSATRHLFGTNLLRTWTTLSLFDEISILFETTRQHFRPRNVVLSIAELSRTTSRFHQIMITLSKPCGHFGHLLQNFNLISWLTVLTNCPKCPHGMDNVIIIWWNLVIVRDNSAIARTT